MGLLNVQTFTDTLLLSDPVEKYVMRCLVIIRPKWFGIGWEWFETRPIHFWATFDNKTIFCFNIKNHDPLTCLFLFDGTKQKIIDQFHI